MTKSRLSGVCWLFMSCSSSITPPRHMHGQAPQGATLQRPDKWTLLLFTTLCSSLSLDLNGATDARQLTISQQPTSKKKKKSEAEKLERVKIITNELVNLDTSPIRTNLWLGGTALMGLLQEPRWVCLFVLHKRKRKKRYLQKCHAWIPDVSLSLFLKWMWRGLFTIFFLTSFKPSQDLSLVTSDQCGAVKMSRVQPLISH